MKTMMSACVAIACLAGTAHAQTFNDLQIRLAGFTVSPDGGEKPMGISYSTGAVAIGRSATSTWSWDGTSCEGWAVSTKAGDFRSDATTAWMIEVTPTRVAGDAVTFRLRWIRFAALKQQAEQFSFDANKAPRGASEEKEIELTLRPGESAPVDAVRLPQGAKTVDGRACGASSSIRVSVDPDPLEGGERRLVSAELWLVERLANRTQAQRSQPLTLRVLPNQPISFYFDRIVDGTVSLDVYGIVKTRLTGKSIGLDVETRIRRSGPSERDFMGPQRSVNAKFGVDPTDIVEIELPPLEDDSGPFAKRTFSIRVRVRQLR